MAFRRKFCRNPRAALHVSGLQSRLLSGMQSLMRILLVSPQPFFEVRGTPLNIRNVASALGQAGHRVDLLCYPFGQEVDLPGVTVLRSPRVPGIRKVKVGASAAKFPLDGLMAVQAFWRILRYRYDVVHAVEESVFFTALPSRLRGIPLVYDMDSLISDQLAYSGFLTWKPLLRLVTGMERRAVKRSARVLTVCQSLTDSVKHLDPDANVHQIEDAPLERTFTPAPEAAAELRERWNLGDRPCIVYTGNFESYQGLSLLVDAMVEVRKQCPEILAVLVGGEQPHIEALKAQIRDRNLEDHVICPGPLPISSMPACMTLASVLAAPRTLGTNTALKIYGYMQTGKPIVATRLETHTQVLDNSCAWLTEVTPADYAAGLVDALTKPEDASEKGRLARARVSERYSLERFHRQVVELYQSLESPT